MISSPEPPAPEEWSWEEAHPTDGRGESLQGAGDGPEDDGPGDEGGGDGEEAAFDGSTIDEIDIESVEIDDTDDDDEEEDDDEEVDEGLEGEQPKAKPTKKKTKAEEDEEEDVPEYPDTPIPTKKVMLSALEWAFENEENVPDGLLERYADHARSMLKANRTMNLTAVHAPKEVAAKHYLDSWRLTRLLPLMAKTVMDLGSGAGFPGIPLAMAEPMLSMVLCESRKQRAGYLEEAVAELGLKNSRVVAQRGEDWLVDEKVNMVIVRAVSSVRENIRTLRKVRHSLRDLVMIKGNSWSRELRAAEREAERLGFRLDTVWEHDLPEEMGHRVVLVYRAPGGMGR